MDRQYPDETIDRVVEQLAEGQSMRTICAVDGMPDRATVWRWGKGDGELAQRIRDAREMGYWMLAERTLEEVRAEPDAIKARVLLDLHRWYLGKLSIAFAEKPVAIGALINVDASEAFGSIAAALEDAAATRASRAIGTRRVVLEGEARPVDAGGALASLAGPGGPGLGEDPDRG